ncbi:MAG: hypothetical protein HQL19_08150, partial [Candidatus Omnitrophica bacterium]|nr:hypothetical protein [Candidatus Omnitrophota bacterium]
MIDTQKLKHDVDQKFPAFGVNKRQEVVRLIFEVAQRDGICPSVVIQGIPRGCTTFTAVK